MNILEVKNLKRYYGSGNTLVRALDGVSFTLEKGEMPLWWAHQAAENPRC